MNFRQSLFRQYTNKVLKNSKVSGEVLDIGSQESTYYHQYFDTKIISLDISGSPTVIGDMLKLPFPAERFDTVLALNVFEHCSDPDLALSQIHRVLKSHGRLVIVTPFFKEIHAHPFDYFRYTLDGWKTLLDKHTFKIIKIHELGNGPFEAIYDMIIQFTPVALRPLVWLPCAILNRLVVNYQPALIKKYPLGYFVVAQKR